MIATFFPPGSYGIAIGASQAIGDGKSQLSSDFLGFFFRIYSACENGDTLFLERFTALCIGGQQPATEGSQWPR